MRNWVSVQSGSQALTAKLDFAKQILAYKLHNHSCFFSSVPYTTSVVEICVLLPRPIATGKVAELAEASPSAKYTGLADMLFPADREGWTKPYSYI